MTQSNEADEASFLCEHIYGILSIVDSFKSIDYPVSTITWYYLPYKERIRYAGMEQRSYEYLVERWGVRVWKLVGQQMKTCLYGKFSVGEELTSSLPFAFFDYDPLIEVFCMTVENTSA